MPATPQGAGRALLGRFASKLRFPQLFALTATLFVLDLLIPDLIPFVDEILLALATILLGSWKDKRQFDEDEDEGEPPPMKDVTPPREKSSSSE